MKRNRPFIFMQRGWYIVRHVLREKGLDGVIVVGRGRKVQSAWNDYSRKYNWYKRGCPGMPVWKNPRRERSNEDEHEAVREVGDGQEGRQEGAGSYQQEGQQG